MDSLSIATRCLTLISDIARTSFLIASFVRDCRAARHDLELISRELTSVEIVLSLLRHDIATTNAQAIPETLRGQITSIISNCSIVLQELDELLQRHNGERMDQAACWATIGNRDAARLRGTLEAHKAALNIALNLLTLTATREIQNDTAAIRQNTTQILAQINSLRAGALLPAGESRNEGSNWVLDRYLDGLTDYAESIYDNGEDSNIENDFTPESSITSYNRRDRSPSQEPVPQDPFLSNIQTRERENSRTGMRRPFIFGNRKSSPYPMRLKGHSGWVLAVAFSPDGSLVASASLDGTIKLWDPATGQSCWTFVGHSSCVRAVAFSPCRKLVVSASLDCTVRLWELTTGGSYKILRGHQNSVQAVAFSPDGKLVASASTDCTVRLWDPITGQVRSELEGHPQPVWAVAFSPDGKLVASASLDGTIRLWDPATGQGRGILEGHSDAVRAVAFSPDSKLIASASHDCTVRLWDPATGQARRTFKGHVGWVQAITFSPDGKLVASASLDCTVRLWDLTIGRSCRMFEGHKDSVQAVAFSPDGKLVASSSNDRTVRLWDPATAQR